VVPVPTPRGLVRYEHRLDVELRVATLPPGMDPDDVVRDDPAAWEALVAEARPVLEHLFDVLTRDLDLGDPRGKTVAADRLMPVVAAIPDPVARAAWVARLSDLIHIDERALAARLAGGGGRKRPRRAPEPPGFDEWVPVEEAALTAAPPRDRPSWLLGHLILDPRRLAELNEQLRAIGQPALSGQDFERATERDLLTGVRYAASGAAPRDAPPEHRLAELPLTHAGYAAALRARAAEEPPLPVADQTSALRQGVLLLRLQARRRRLAELQQVMADATPEERARFGARIRELVAERHTLERLLAPGREPGFGKTDQATSAR
jgi:DNA primase